MQPVTFVLCLVVLGAHSLLVFGADCEIAGQKLNKGETYKPPDRCIQHTCLGAPRRIQTVMCPSVASLKPCKLVSDTSKPYPACCPKYEC
ncbi:uncharacterized protein Dana_GF20393 [Drosophila ananassae]|uniref:Single domain-containing protein n=1 Tax=Drosophila ananassae TaxID=7217 RepID=B3MQ74_DROAN|nr:la1-like protein 15 [Drosophila ananassae]EDV44500.1 uncharacterized protein Dana_GF20393 [Drosophila ananassae]KAH8315380.1 hypothetical protein KR067_002072 [Drosophila pandora]